MIIVTTGHHCAIGFQPDRMSRAGGNRAWRMAAMVLVAFAAGNAEGRGLPYEASPFGRVLSVFCQKKGPAGLYPEQNKKYNESAKDSYQKYSCCFFVIDICYRDTIHKT